jgi:hypothetical protein
VDGHTALDSSVIGRAQAGDLEVVLVRLVHGRYDIVHTIHLAPTSSLNMSGRLVAPDVFAQLKLPLAGCKFTHAGVCAWRQVAEETSLDTFASTMSQAIQQLSDADRALLNSMFLELPKPETGQLRSDRYLGSLGDGHRGQEVKRFDDPPEDERFRYRLTYLKRSERDAGWVTHLIPKGEVTPEMNAALRLLGLQRFEECPEADFDACMWRAVINPHAGEFVEDFIEENRPADLAHNSFRALPQALPGLLDRIVDAHRLLEPLGFEYLPTPEPIRAARAPRQQFIPAGSPYDAYATIREIVAGAGAWLGIVDPYIDNTMADLLLAAPKRTQIQLLTRTIKGDGVLALKKLAAQRGQLDVRIDPSDFHDRFILTDSSAYHLGPSIKDAGLKSAMITRIDEAGEAQRARAQFNSVWNSATDAL